MVKSENFIKYLVSHGVTTVLVTNDCKDRFSELIELISTSQLELYYMNSSNETIEYVANNYSGVNDTIIISSGLEMIKSIYDIITKTESKNIPLKLLIYNPSDLDMHPEYSIVYGAFRSIMSNVMMETEGSMITLLDYVDEVPDIPEEYYNDSIVFMVEDDATFHLN